MPQASDSMRNYWGSPDDAPVMHYLNSRGFTLTPEWEWIAPAEHIFTAKDLNALSFLIEEWDFAGLTANSPEPDYSKFERHEWNPWTEKQ